MPNGPIDPLSGPRYVLEGRVVTMGPQGVLADGAIYIDQGSIVAVRDTGDPPPSGFEDAPRIDTGDSIYPGLIELHNHLSYNAMPLWDVPRRFSNHERWKRHEDYRRLVTKPAQVLGRTENVVEAVVRYVECRCLLGGVTASQGITLNGASAIEQIYRGIVRNVEQTEDPDLPDAHPRIGDPENNGAAAYLARLAGKTCYLQHLSEGVDARAHEFFERLQLADGDWAITNAFCGVHSTALTAEDFRILADKGASMVWSPLSNYLLYGETADIRAAKDVGIPIGIGSDWGPSGSKNLLGEMKVAWLASQEVGKGTPGGVVFTAEDIVAMATRNAAQILRWDALGTLEAGKRADLVVVNGKAGDDYLRLIEARETSLTLVVINGVPRVGQKRLMQRFGPGTEEIEVGRSTRVLNLAQTTSHPLVQNLTLGAATTRLRDAMLDLPKLATDIDNALAGGLFGGSADADGESWRIVLDFEREDDTLEHELGLGGLPFADFVQPMELPGITVADDPHHLPALVSARNLPEFVKKGLPPLYGEDIPLPDSANFLEEAPAGLPRQLLETRDLKTFLRSWGSLTLADRKTIVNQAVILLEENYVHLPLKRAMHAVDPVQRLKLQRHRLEQTVEGELPPEIEFHDEISGIFNSLRDLHTTYRLPHPFKSKTAWLPFLIEEYWEHGHRKYMVSKVVGDAGPETFVPGVEVIHWNGMPIDQAVTQNADRQAGSNTAARRARGLDSLTIRPLARGLPPKEEWVTLRYRGDDGEVHELTQEWLVFEPGRSTRSLDPEALLAPVTALGLDANTDDIHEAKKVLFAAEALLREEEAVASAGPTNPIENLPGGIPTHLPTLFRAGEFVTDHGRFGHIRIFSFNVTDADEFVDEFVRLAEELPQEGLVIDVRGNGGGLIHAAERLLQVLTPKEIDPERAHFINTSRNLDLCRRHAPSPLFADFDLGPWVSSIEQSVATGATHSLGHPITPRDRCNDVGQRYYGPVVLITDALCYSATDIFAAGFRDHGIGLILGTSPNTGAGGANVWSHRLLRRLMETSDEAAEERPSYAPLPGGADLRVAIRRTVRVGTEAGSIVEDLGIHPDHLHRLTKADLLEGNRDLMGRAAALLSAQPVYGIEVRFEPGAARLPVARVRTRNVSRLDLTVCRRPRGSFDVRGEEISIDLSEAAGEIAEAEIDIELHGFAGEEHVLTRRERIHLDPA